MKIEIRAWDTKGKVMLNWDTITQTAFNRTMPPDYYGLMYRILTEYQFEKMLWTGFLDKNDKKIFDGDIVKSESHTPSIMEVKFIEGGFCCDWGDKNYPLDINHFYPSTGCQLEVIGNIYENYNLLKGDKAMRLCRIKKGAIEHLKQVGMYNDLIGDIEGKLCFLKKFFMEDKIYPHVGVEIINSPLRVSFGISPEFIDDFTYSLSSIGAEFDMLGDDPYTFVDKYLNLFFNQEKIS